VEHPVVPDALVHFVVLVLVPAALGDFDHDFRDHGIPLSAAMISHKIGDSNLISEFPARDNPEIRILSRI
jgi:hypothetical protein